MRGPAFGAGLWMKRNRYWACAKFTWGYCAGAARVAKNAGKQEQMKLVSIPANPAPDDVVTGMLKTPDGVSLRFARFAPPPGRRGTVCIFPGRTEWIEKYFETARDLRNRGFAVAILDWRGQGLSDRALGDRLKGYVGSFSEFDTDLETFMRQVVLPDCPPPIFALGHSMGATVLIRAVPAANAGSTGSFSRRRCSASRLSDRCLSRARS